jgi:hypothetical protein
MRSFQVFAGMSREASLAFLRTLQEKAPGTFAQAVAAASLAQKARPAWLQRQPFETRADAVRRAMSRVASNPVAEELLAVYFLECRRPLLVEWLDLLGLEHEDGSLAEDAPEPPAPEKLRDAVAKFRTGADAADRELLLRAFAAQSAIDWPELEALLG